MTQSAAKQGDVETVRRMLDYGVPVDAGGESGVTFLMTAAQHGRLQVVRLLLARGADPNARDHEGRTALRRAEEWDHPGSPQPSQEQAPSDEAAAGAVRPGLRDRRSPISQPAR